MASSTTAVKTKITDTFTVTDDNGIVYQVQQHTRYEVKKVDGVKSEILGRAYFLTEDGRGVLKNEKDNTYSIPSLGLKAVR
jgi:hypothetical protein